MKKTLFEGFDQFTFFNGPKNGWKIYIIVLSELKTMDDLMAFQTKCFRAI